MPATALTPTQLTHTGTVTLGAAPGAAADATNGNTFPNGGSSLLLMNNTAGTSATVAVAFSSTVDGQSVTPRSYTIPANTILMTKLGPVALYGSTVTVTASATTVKLAVYAL